MSCLTAPRTKSQAVRTRQVCIERSIWGVWDHHHWVVLGPRTSYQPRLPGPPERRSRDFDRKKDKWTRLPVSQAQPLLYRQQLPTRRYSTLSPCLPPRQPKVIMAVDPVSDKPTPEGVAPPAEHDEVSMAHAAILAEERSLSKIQCIKRHPAAFFWAIFAAFQVLLVSYENQAAGMAVGIPRFREDFGSEYNGNYVLDPAWQGAFSAGPVGS